VITEATKVHLVESLAASDWERLNLTTPDEKAAYPARWDITNPESPWETNPLVWRVVFHYLPTKECT
jgi:hypothetical protein